MVMKFMSKILWLWVQVGASTTILTKNVVITNTGYGYQNMLMVTANTYLNADGVKSGRLMPTLTMVGAN